MIAGGKHIRKMAWGDVSGFSRRAALLLARPARQNSERATVANKLPAILSCMALMGLS